MALTSSLFVRSLLILSIVLLPISSLINASNLISCSAKNDCYINCNAADPSSCDSKTIQCPTHSDYECAITCSARHSCTNLTIQAQDVGYLDVKCWGYQSCVGMTVYGPISVNDTLFTLTANLYYAASSSIFYLNDTADIEITCQAEGSCSDSIIYAQNGQSFTGYFSDSNTFSNGTIIADQREMIGIQCDDDGCYDAVIYGESTDDLSLECSTSNSCDDMRLYCPNSFDSHSINSGDASYNTLCTVSCRKSGSCSDLTIYQKDGFDAGILDLECNGNDNFCFGIIMVYGESYTDWCSVGFDFHDEFGCYQEVPTTSEYIDTPTDHPVDTKDPSPRETEYPDSNAFNLDATILSVLIVFFGICCGCFCGCGSLWYFLISLSCIFVLMQSVSHCCLLFPIRRYKKLEDKQKLSLDKKLFDKVQTDPANEGMPNRIAMAGMTTKNTGNDPAESEGVGDERIEAKYLQTINEQEIVPTSPSMSQEEPEEAPAAFEL